MANVKCNPDLVRERAKCSFDVNELIHLIDGGENATKEKRHFEETIFSVKELQDAVPEEYLSHKDRYENAVRKATILRDVCREYMKKYNYKPNRFRVGHGVFKDVSPFLLHDGMFVATIIGQGTPEQQAEWLPKAENMQIIGTYAQTELGHGSFIRGLETRATYDPKTEEFILNNATLSSFKWWPGGLGSTVNHCIVVAQLFINGKSYGIQPFIVQIRDLNTHKPLPGVKVGEIGPKMGFQTANNGFLGFENFRIPRMNMLMKNAQVLKDGTFVKGMNEKLTYGTMVMVRVGIVGDCSLNTSLAATIAVRYSAVRHQSKIKAKEPEVQILDYVTQQHKLFIAIASSHVFRNVYSWLSKSYLNVMKDLAQGKQDHLPELHATACCLKAVCSRDAGSVVEECRLACGGHGYMTSSNLPLVYGFTIATVTYEGEQTVLLLQTARYLVKAWLAALQGKVLAPSVSYLSDWLKNDNVRWQNTPEGIVKGFQHVAAGKVKAAYDTIQKYIKLGKDYEDAWNLASVQLMKASEAHSRSILCEVSWGEVIRTSASPNLLQVLKQLAQLYLVYWTLETSGDFLVYSNISKDDIAILREKYEELLAAIRPNAVGLVDAFDLRDEILHSTLGSYDGRVYERLMEEALKSPLNQESVNASFHKYLKPLMEKAKL
ncbi:unnamed protein product [Diatraea saccharalis]|uniref:Acyl-coenzyme A oxidase n=1 Tax=Diatraea saccharalis TaxID=40085 RepID=A0A9N9RH68_9NEOP|nr:unnamed protein product [Diatraea saccharalis]